MTAVADPAATRDEEGGQVMQLSYRLSGLFVLALAATVASLGAVL